MHPLIHLWARSRLDVKGQHYASLNATLMVYRSYNFHQTRDMNQAHLLEPHLLALSGHLKVLWGCEGEDSSFIQPGGCTSHSWVILRTICGWWFWFTSIAEEAKKTLSYLRNTPTWALQTWEMLYRLRQEISSKSAREELLRTVLCRMAQELPISDPRVLAAIGDYAFVLYQIGNLTQSRELYVWLHSTRSIVLGRRHPATMGALMGIGFTAPSCPEAFRDLQKATEIRMAVLGANDTLTKNANAHFQEIARHCPELIPRLAQWNLEVMAQQLKHGVTFPAVLSFFNARWEVVVEMLKQLLHVRSGRIDSGITMIEILLDDFRFQSRLPRTWGPLDDHEIQGHIFITSLTWEYVADLVDIIVEFYHVLGRNKVVLADIARCLEGLLEWSEESRGNWVASHGIRAIGPHNYLSAKLSLALAILLAERERASLPSPGGIERNPADNFFSHIYAGRNWGFRLVGMVIVDDEWARYVSRGSSGHTVHILYIVSSLSRYLEHVHRDFQAAAVVDLSSQAAGKLKDEENLAFPEFALSLLWPQIYASRPSVIPPRHYRVARGYATDVPSDMPRFAYDWYLRQAPRVCHSRLDYLYIILWNMWVGGFIDCPGSAFLEEILRGWGLVGEDQSESCFSDFRGMYMCRAG